MKKKIYFLLPLVSIALIFINNNAFAGGLDRKTSDPWLFYIGGFAAYYSADFQYGGNYFSNDANNQVYNNTSFQQGASGGGQIGMQYHFQSPYFLGLNFSADSNANKARLTVIAASAFPVGLSPNLNHQFRIGVNVDMTGVIGTDITAKMHLYAKIGASYAELTHTLTGTPIGAFPSSTIIFARLQRKSLWGWVVGAGLTQDLSRWLNVFAEYDRYDYSNNELNSYDSLFPGNVDRLTQHMRATSSAVRVGLNVKFMDSFSPIGRITITNPWLIYLGGFAAYYSADFQYGGNYFSTFFGNDNSQIYNNTVFQQGVAGGGQLGFHYHFQSPYSFGFNFSVASNANKARLKVSAVAAPPGDLIPNINHQFRIATNMDMTGVIGADITAQTHLYAKIGASYAKLTHSIVGTLTTLPSPGIVFAQVQRQSLWGWVVGIGLTQDLSRYLNAFVEYERYDYGNNELNSLDSLLPGTGIDRLTQHARITSSALRLGLNLKFMSSFAPVTRIVITNPWLIYLGGFAGYYSADFQYGSNYFSNLPSNQIYNNTSFQQGVSGGGQLGFHYHFQSPYSLGFNLSATSNANKARLTVVDVFVTGDPGCISHQFHINTNMDITGVIGADITARTHLYAKIGASYAKLTHSIIVTLINLPSPTAVFARTQHKNLWGWVVGVGLTQDLSRWLNVFVEYDRYDYGNNELNSYDSLFPMSVNQLTQHVRAVSFAARLGLNVKFEF